MPGSDRGGDGLGVWTVTVVPHGACRNDPRYNGTLYVLTRNGKLGMQMLPELAQVLPTQLRNAASLGESVRIRHKVVKVSTTYATLAPETARDLAARIDHAVGA